MDKRHSYYKEIAKISKERCWTQKELTKFLKKHDKTNPNITLKRIKQGKL